MVSPTLESGSHPDVVEEHLEEAAFLYEQRAYLASRGLDDWRRLGSIEARLGAHLIGLGVAGVSGLDLARAAAPRSPGAAFCAGSLLPQTASAEHAFAEVSVLPEASRVCALHGLSRVAPPDWDAVAIADLRASDPARVQAAADYASRRGLDAGADALRALAAAAPETAGLLIGLLGDLVYPPARSVLARRYLDDGPPETRRAAAYALLRLGHPRALAAFVERIGAQPGSALAAALLGGPAQRPPLLTALRAGHAEAALALGVLGDAGDAAALVDALASPDEAVQDAAALGLRVLTGADLLEERTVLDDPDDPDLGGDVVARPSTDAGAWRAWLSDRQEPLKAGRRYRLGRLFQPQDACSALRDTVLPAPLRAALADELAGRYGLAGPFRADAFVLVQAAAIDTLETHLSVVHAPMGAWASVRGSRPAS